MMHQTDVRLKDSIATKLLKSVFFFYIIVALIITALHMVTEYRRVRTSVIDDINIFHLNSASAMAIALWDADGEQMRRILEGLVTSPLILGVKVTDNTGRVVGRMGHALQPDRRAGQRPAAPANGQALAASSGLNFNFPLIYTDAEAVHPIGTVEFLSSEGVVFDKVKYGFLYIIASSIVKAAILWGIFLYFSRSMLQRPLGRLTEAAGKLDLENLERIEINARTSGRNELWVLERVFKSMVAKLVEGRDELNRLFSALKAHRDDLEETVSARTQQLSRVNRRLTREIEDKARAEMSLKKSLADKEVLLKEVHHRVKNNLQMIQSLLNLQVARITVAEDAAPLLDSKNRIKSIALVHETLYRTADLSEVNVHLYLKELVRHILVSISVSEPTVDLKFDLEEIRMDIDAITACGLIVNELVTNAVKYACSGDGAGAIEISLRPVGGSRAELAVRDSGPGISEKVDFENPHTLGLRLVRIMAEEQLGGTLHIDQQDGFQIKVSFPLPGSTIVGDEAA